MLLPSEILRRSARLHRSRSAVIADGRTQTFGELYERSCRLANALLAAGLVPGDRVAVLGDNWGDPAATRERLAPQGCIKTGDIGYLDEEGFLYLLDRKDDVIISGGINIWPAEVENCLLAHPGIAEASVFAVPHLKWGETPLATVVLRPGSTATEDDLILWCRDRLGPAKKPTRVVFADWLPLDPGGKIRRRALQQPYWAGQQRHVGEV
jgi:acyl-CoA synthetase (AMP-forming)/AMP-acid ligase II